MNRRQYLLLKLSEECNELGKQCSKQMQFGRNERHEVLKIRNCDLTRDEALDVLAMIHILMEKSEIPVILSRDVAARVVKRKKKIARYMRYSRKLGMVK